jgi:hypothetical protein
VLEPSVVFHFTVPSEPSRLTTMPSSDAMCTLPSDPIAGVADIPLRNATVHCGTPVDTDSAYIVMSAEPTYTRPKLALMAGVLVTKSPVVYVHKTEPEEPDSEYTLPSWEPIKIAPLGPTAADPVTRPPVARVHTTAPVEADRQYTLLSSEPTYSKEPSKLNAGDDSTLPVVARIHRVVNVDVNEYTFQSSLPTYTLPSGPITGEDKKKLPAVYIDTSAPVAPFSAYRVRLLREPMYTVPSKATAAEAMIELEAPNDQVSVPEVADTAWIRDAAEPK